MKRVKPFLNIGVIGHVDHGKSTLIAASNKVSYGLKSIKIGSMPDSEHFREFNPEKDEPIFYPDKKVINAHDAQVKYVSWDKIDPISFEISAGDENYKKIKNLIFNAKQKFIQAKINKPSFARPVYIRVLVPASFPDKDIKSLKQFIKGLYA